MTNHTDVMTRRLGDIATDAMRQLALLQPRSWSALGLSVAYIALYVLLDWVSNLELLHGLDVTPWQPEPGLSIALLLAAGLEFVPVVMIGAFVSTQLLMDVPVPLSAGLLAALAIGGGYTVAAAVLRHVFRIDPRLHRSRDIVTLIAVVTGASGLVVLGYVASYASAHLLAWSEARAVFVQLWIGNAIGGIVTAPLVLVLIDDPPRLKRLFARPIRVMAVLETIVQWASIAGALALVFGFSRYRAELFYMLFLPLVWIAARRGLAGATWAVLSIQVGLIIVLEIAGGPVAIIRTFQLLMFAVATTGLMLGAFVSERHRVARALADSRSHLATILNAARDGVLTIDPGGRIESVNPSVEKLFGRPAEVLVGRSIRELIDPLPMPSAIPPADATQQEVTARHADGGSFPIELTIGPFGAPGDEHYTLVIRDITARRTAETRTRMHQSELAKVSRLTLAGEMASALAHELNQPLTAIAAYARGCLRLLKPSTSDVLQEGLREVVQQAERAADVITRLRDFVRTGSLQRRVVEPRDLVERTLALIRADAAQIGIELRSRVAAGLPAVLVDRIHIEQVILNLARNAMDAMAVPSGAAPSGAPRVVTLDARQTDRHTVEITVADSGPGVRGDVVARLFHPFITTKPGGMGLGLAISHSMIEAHGGQLRLARNSGRGAAFAFDLPIADSEETAHA